MDEAFYPVLCMGAEDAYSQAQKAAHGPVVAPAVDPRLSSEWEICGTLTAQDAILRLGPLQVGAERVFYGWCLKSVPEPDRFAVLIRGTGDIVEWLEDAEFSPRRALPGMGEVESGFYDIYQTLQVDGEPLIKGLSERIGSGSVEVIGHSLGAALGTYTAFDMSESLGSRVKARLVASPHPGDETFSKAFADRVPDHLMYANSADRVPQVPFLFGYCPVPKVRALSAHASGLDLCSSWACQHHAAVYASLMSCALPKPEWLLPCDAPYVACIKSLSVV